MSETEIKTEIKTIIEGEYTGELEVKQRKSKYDFEALCTALKANKKYALPNTVTSVTTADNIKRRLAEKKITASYGFAKGTKQFVFFPVEKTEKKSKS